MHAATESDTPGMWYPLPPPEPEAPEEPPEVEGVGDGVYEGVHELPPPGILMFSPT
jgi:hypothetical protein